MGLLDDYLRCTQCPKVTPIPKATEKGWLLLGKLGAAEPAIFCSPEHVIAYLQGDEPKKELPKSPPEEPV